MQREKRAYAPVFYPVIILASILALLGIIFAKDFSNYMPIFLNFSPRKI